VKSVVVKLDELITQIQLSQVRQYRTHADEPLLITISTKKTAQDQTTGKLNGQFVHSQLLIDVLIRMKSASTDKNELVSLCNENYKGDNAQLTIINEFEQHYSPDQALWWYTRESFIYRLLNKALRMENIDLLFLFRFFIRDIRRQLENNQFSSSVRVYRGQSMSNDELQTIKDSIGGFISINSFFSTSIDRDQALSFLRSSAALNDCQKVLFQIDLDPRLVTTKPFADITNFSYFPKERELLIMLGSVFRIVRICRDKDNVWLIEIVLCSDNDHDLKAIFEHMKNEYDDGDGETSLISFGLVLYEMGKIDHAEKYFHRLLNELPEDHANVAGCLHNLGMVVEAKGDYNASLKYYQKSLAIIIQTFQLDHPHVAESHNCIGCVHLKRSDYKRALESYTLALTIFRKVFGESHSAVAGCNDNIGIVHEKQKNYSEALKYFETALLIRQKCLPVNHPDLGSSYNNIGNLYRSLGCFDRALEHYNSSLKILSKSLPPEHPQVASILNNIGNVYEDKRELKQALSYFQRAAAIYYNAFAPTHPVVIETAKNIQRVESQLK
ncbi:unnamed protein product, partial [Adineta steineri]